LQEDRLIVKRERKVESKGGREGWREGGMTGLDTATCCMLLA